MANASDAWRVQHVSSLRAAAATFEELLNELERGKNDIAVITQQLEAACAQAQAEQQRAEVSEHACAAERARVQQLMNDLNTLKLDQSVASGLAINLSGAAFPLAGDIAAKAKDVFYGDALTVFVDIVGQERFSTHTAGKLLEKANGCVVATVRGNYGARLACAKTALELVGEHTPTFERVIMQVGYRDPCSLTCLTGQQPTTAQEVYPLVVRDFENCYGVDLKRLVNEWVSQIGFRADEAKGCSRVEEQLLKCVVLSLLQ